MSLTTWNNVHNSLILIASAWALCTKTHLILVLACAGSLSYLIYRYRSESLHAANALTGLRFMIVSLAFLTPFAAPLAMSLYLLALIADGLDGLLARRLGVSSPAGAYFDMETDSFAIVSLVLLHSEQYGASLWLILVGLARPLITIAKAQWWPHAKQERRSRWGRLLFVGFYLCLIADYLFHHAATRVPLMLSSALIIWSFALDVQFFRTQQPWSPGIQA